MISPDSVESLVRLLDVVPMSHSLSAEVSRTVRILGEPDSLSYLTEGVIHGDAAFDNALVLKEDVRWIDFDNCRRGRLVWDLLHLVSHAAVVRLIDNETANLDIGAVLGSMDDALCGYAAGDGIDLGIGQVGDFLRPLGLALIVKIISETNLDDPEAPSHDQAEDLVATVLATVRGINGE